MLNLFSIFSDFSSNKDELLPQDLNNFALVYFDLSLKMKELF